VTAETQSPSRAAPDPSNRQRVSRRRVDKFEQRRAALATAAMDTLAELGYAQTSLRDIAARSGYSHGVLHYYFADKVDLITHCVTEYKARCIERYDQIVADAPTAGALVDGFAQGLADTARDDAFFHRLWYDLRSQSMFEHSFQTAVAAIDDSLERMIWRILSRYAELVGRPLAVDQDTAYALFDGLFQHALLHHLAGNELALSDLATSVRTLMPRLLAGATQ
jgi:AcrR family transcriptional regulator